MLAALIGALAAVVTLAGILTYVIIRLTEAHKAERTATVEQERLTRELYASQAREAIMKNTERDFRAANDTWSEEYGLQTGDLDRERARATHAEHQRDDLIRQLAAHEDPAALVASINAELAKLAGQGP
jgi:biopolymer transport protein ExbB/TolQ